MVFDEIDQLSAAQEGKGGHDTEGLQSQPIKKQTLQSWLSGELGSHGISIFLTTNHLNNIDKLILRSGRVDKMIEFPHEITKPTVEKILKIRYDRDRLEIDLKRDSYPGRTAADLHQFLDGKTYEAAAEGLQAWLVKDN